MKKRLLFVPVFMMLGLFSYNGLGQTIYTCAGNGTSGYSGDGGLATLAQLKTPSGIAIDDSGNVYACDQNANTVRKINARTGIITTVAGTGAVIGGYTGDGGMATDAELYYPEGVAVDRHGNLYIADQFNNAVRKVNSAGIISTIAGTGVSGYFGDGGAATNAMLYKPQDVGVDSSGNVYALDCNNQVVRKITISTGIITTIAGTYDLMGSYSGDGGPATDAHLNYPQGIAVDSIGDLLIADYGNSRVRFVNAATGIITTVAGNGENVEAGDGALATEASLAEPSSVAMDALGNMYIDDVNGSTIRKVYTNGIINRIAGNGTAGYNGDGIPADSASLAFPEGVAVNDSGFVFSADYENSRVREIKNVPTTPMLKAIIGIDTLCVGVSTVLSDSVSVRDSIGFRNISIGGVWSSSNASVAIIDSASGRMVGLNSGTATISYSAYGVSATSVVEVKSCHITDTVCRGDSTTLGDFASVTGTHWVWSSGNASIAKADSATGEIKGIATGTAVISYTDTTGGANLSAMVTIAVKACPNGVENISNGAIPVVSVFPNPSQGSFKLNIATNLSLTPGNAVVTISDMMGQKVKELAIPIDAGIANKDTEIQLNVAPGVYFLSAVISNEKVNLKIIVE